MVLDYSRVVDAIGGVPKLPPNLMEGGGYGKHRVNHNAHIGGKEIPIDVRFAGDGYIDETWMRDIISSRELHRGGVYTPNSTHSYFFMLYHAVVQKPSMAEDYKVTPRKQSKSPEQLRLINGSRTDHCKLLVPFMRVSLRSSKSQHE